jgi:transglutaminase-like putative cysteine protease
MTESIMVRVGCEFGFVSSAPTHSVLQVEPNRTDRATMLKEEWTFTSDVRRRGYRDLYGNLCQRIDLPEGPFSLRYDALVEVPPERDEADEAAMEAAPGALPDDVLVYTLPSRYCLSDELADEAWRLFGAVPGGWGRVQAICDFVHESITFQAGSSSQRTTAADVYRDRAGVCRDYAHLAISFCRALNIPARYTFGYIPDIDVPPDDSLMDFAAWMEVWLGGRWYTFDPRNNHRRVGRVLVGRGRDALDCAMLTSYGDARLETMLVWADQVPVGAAAAQR